jgi:hypothetical protein
MCMQYYNDCEISKFINLITRNFKDKEIIEIRAIGVTQINNGSTVNYEKPKIFIGYFNNLKSLLTEIKTITVAKSIYFQLNKTNIINFNKSPNRFTTGISACNGELIDKRQIILIDVDCIGEFNGPSTDSLHKQSEDVARNIAKYLYTQGFSQPCIIDSGNGSQLLYSVDIDCSEDNTRLIENFLKTLREYNKVQDIKIDTVVYDIPRISKLPGTRNCKTDIRDKDSNGNINKRQHIHRMSKILYLPAKFEATDISKFKAVTKEYKNIVEQEDYTNCEANSEAEETRIQVMIQWLDNEGYGYKRVRQKNNRKFIDLQTCLLTEHHTIEQNPAFIIFPNGAITYKCFGETCGELKWKEFKEAYGFKSTISPNISDWETPDISSGLEVAEVTQDMVPELFWKYSNNVAKRVSCPVDYPIMSLYSAFGGVIGRRYYCQPYKNNTSFKCFPTVFSIAVGIPSVRKTPGTEDAIKIVEEIDSFNKREYIEKKKNYEEKKEALEILIKQIEKKMNKETEIEKIEELQVSKLHYEETLEEETPRYNRIVYQEGTIEKITEILSEQGNYGLLLHNDEIYSTFRTFLKAGRETDRQFYLKLYNGNGKFVDVKVGRGVTEVEGLCGSVTGTTQPNRLKELLYESANTGTSDGLMARFLIIWPKEIKKKVTDIAPDEISRTQIRRIMMKINRFIPINEYNEPEPEAVLLDEEAYELYINWQEELIKREEEGLEMKAIEEMLGKESGTLPKIALINYLVDRNSSRTTSNTIQKTHMEKAIKYMDYVESHAHKAYSSNGIKISHGSEALLSMIYKGEVKEEFKLSEIYRREVKYLRKIGIKTSREVCQNVVKELITDGWLQEVKNGRTIKYKIHPQFNQHYEKFINGKKTETTKKTETKTEETQNSTIIEQQIYKMVNDGWETPTDAPKKYIKRSQEPQSAIEHNIMEHIDIL